MSFLVLQRFEKRKYPATRTRVIPINRNTKEATSDALSFRASELVISPPAVPLKSCFNVHASRAIRDSYTPHDTRAMPAYWTSAPCGCATTSTLRTTTFFPLPTSWVPSASFSTWPRVPPSAETGRPSTRRSMASTRPCRPQCPFSRPAGLLFLASAASSDRRSSFGHPGQPPSSDVLQPARTWVTTLTPRRLPPLPKYRQRPYPARTLVGIHHVRPVSHLQPNKQAHSSQCSVLTGLASSASKELFAVSPRTSNSAGETEGI